jgi:hypothetical protein
VERIRNMVISAGIRKIAFATGGLLLTTATGYLYTLFFHGGNKADKYLNNKVHSAREKLEEISVSIFDFAEDILIAHTPDAMDSAISKTIATLKTKALEYQNLGLESFEEWVDRVEDNFREQATQLVKAQKEKEVFKILSRIQQTASSATKFISPLVDVAIDIIGDQLEAIIKATTKENVEELSIKTSRKIDTHSTALSDKDKETLKKMITTLLQDKQEKVIEVSDFASLSILLNEFLKDIKKLNDHNNPQDSEAPLTTVTSASSPEDDQEDDEIINAALEDETFIQEETTTTDAVLEDDTLIQGETTTTNPDL